VQFGPIVALATCRFEVRARRDPRGLGLLWIGPNGAGKDHPCSTA